VTHVRYGGNESRRSHRQDRNVRVILEYQDYRSEIRTVDISENGVLVPRRLPPAIGTRVRITLIVGDTSSLFEGIVVRHTKCMVNHVQTTGVGIDIASPDYKTFVKDKILIS